MAYPPLPSPLTPQQQQQIVSAMNRMGASLDQCMTGLKANLEFTIKVELGGTMANLDTRLDERFNAVNDRLDRLEQLLDRPKT